MRPYYFDFERYRSRGPYRRFDEYSLCRALGELLREVPSILRTWRKRVRERRELAGLDVRMRRDIGVTAHDVARECAKPFWRA
jgi:uncharacterized protein YjiS (DUF1127 family)